MALLKPTGYWKFPSKTFSGARTGSTPTACATLNACLLRPPVSARYYASRSRKQVTVFNDDGSTSWKNLTVGEKAARTAQQAGNASVIACGVIGLVIVIYLMKDEVFGSDSKTRHFNRAVNRIRADPKALELLGSRKTIKAYGEPTSSKWPVARPIASNTSKDSSGMEHLRMHFNVEGSERKGIVQIHMVKGPGHPDYDYRLLALDVPGHPRHCLEDASTVAAQGKKAAGVRMLGVQWR